jgi:hypothetical protein
MKNNNSLAIFETHKIRRHYDEKTEKWVQALYLKFGIVGGRGGGYRGYSIKENVTPGKWRVDVMTERGQLLGRYRFDAVSSGAPTDLRTEVR